MEMVRAEVSTRRSYGREQKEEEKKISNHMMDVCVCLS